MQKASSAIEARGIQFLFGLDLSKPLSDEFMGLVTE